MYLHTSSLTAVNCGTLTNQTNGQVSYTAGTIFRQTPTHSCNMGYTTWWEAGRDMHGVNMIWLHRHAGAWLAKYIPCYITWLIRSYKSCFHPVCYTTVSGPECKSYMKIR